ncbi:hypothetical protein DPMN_165929 [Dreissena polymorpha]|uniref:Uncharacterized protein n=1 Tax=Dreissena polymorpha TaxID=45954 RepID=A0A9D4F167_DREPO|nr:hypothetical protein DPMN_165929 [Dreissena polymorpha]
MAIFSHTQQQMQVNTNIEVNNSSRLGNTFNRGNSDVFKTNASTDYFIKVQGDLLDELGRFIFLGSILNNNGKTDADVRPRIDKARAALHQMKSI